MVLLFSLFLWASIWKVYLAIPLFLGLVLLTFYAFHKGHAKAEVWGWLKTGMLRIRTMMLVFLFIGILIPGWMAAGTIPMLVYHGLIHIPPFLFVLGAFLLSALMAMLLGTAFGVAGTIGLVLMIMAKVGGVPLAITAGAIFSGAYLGDRTSPMSTSALLVAELTRTNIYQNVGKMLKSVRGPLFICVLFYGILALQFPLREIDEGFLSQIPLRYGNHIYLMIPVFILLILMLLKVHIRWAMALSGLSAVFLCFFQGMSAGDMGKTLFWGFREHQNPDLAPFFSSSGLYGMLKLSLTVLLSSTYADYLKGLQMLRRIEHIGGKLKQKSGRFSAMLFSSIFSASFGCTQTVAIILGHKLMTDHYEEGEKETLMLDLENSAVLISVLIPWNTSSFVPMALLGANLSYLPFALFVYLVPLWHLFLGVKANYPRNFLQKERR